MLRDVILRILDSAPMKIQRPKSNLHVEFEQFRDDRSPIQGHFFKAVLLYSQPSEMSSTTRHHLEKGTIHSHWKKFTEDVAYAVIRLNIAIDSRPAYEAIGRYFTQKYPCVKVESFAMEGHGFRQEPEWVSMKMTSSNHTG